MLSLESAVFLLATLLNGYIIHSQLQKSFLFVFLSLLLAVLLVFYNRFSLVFLQQKDHKPFLLIGLFLSSFFVQLLVVATGGLFSGFVIALHIFTLAMSVLFQVSSAIVFLLLSVSLLMSAIVFDPQMKLLFSQDPWSVVLQGISFLVIIPLAHMLVSTYHLKDTISKMLTENLKTKELQDESIFRGIGEMVFIADKNLEIIFANEAAKRSLGLETKQIIGSDLLTLLSLASLSGEPATAQTLSFEASIADKSVHLVKGFYFKSKSTNHKMPVVVQIRPIFEADKNTLKQLIVVLTPDLTGINPDSVDIQMAYAHTKQISLELEKELAAHRDNSKDELVILMAQISDLFLFQTITSHGIEQHKSPINSVELLAKSITLNQDFFNALKIAADFRSAQVDLVRTATMAHDTNYSLYSHLQKNTLINKDPDWTLKLFSQLLKLFSLLASASKQRTLEVRIGFNDMDQLIVIFATQTDPQIGKQAEQLLLQNYGLAKDAPFSNQGSGIEGVLAQKLSELIEISFSLHFDSVSNYIYCNLILPLDKPELNNKELPPKLALTPQPLGWL